MVGVGGRVVRVGGRECHVRWLVGFFVLWFVLWARTCGFDSLLVLDCVDCVDCVGLWGGMGGIVG